MGWCLIKSRDNFAFCGLTHTLRKEENKVFILSKHCACTDMGGMELAFHMFLTIKKQKETPWFQSTKQTITTERPPLVAEVSANFSA
jgi:hypothetical protein